MRKWRNTLQKKETFEKLYGNPYLFNGFSGKCYNTYTSKKGYDCTIIIIIHALESHYTKKSKKVIRNLM